MPRKPLISLDSDERIQGSPRESKSHKRGSSQRNSQDQENPNRRDEAPANCGRRTRTGPLQTRSGFNSPRERSSQTSHDRTRRSASWAADEPVRSSKALSRRWREVRVGVAARQRARTTRASTNLTKTRR